MFRLKAELWDQFANAEKPLDAAKVALAMGLMPTPVIFMGYRKVPGRDKAKKQMSLRQSWNTERATSEQILAWAEWQDDRVLCGIRSGFGIVNIDMDLNEEAPPDRRAPPRIDKLSLAHPELANCPIMQTPSGGYQVISACPTHLPKWQEYFTAFGWSKCQVTEMFIVPPDPKRLWVQGPARSGDSAHIPILELPWPERMESRRNTAEQMKVRDGKKDDLVTVALSAGFRMGERDTKLNQLAGVLAREVVAGKTAYQRARAILDIAVRRSDQPAGDIYPQTKAYDRLDHWIEVDSGKVDRSSIAVWRTLASPDKIERPDPIIPTWINQGAIQMSSAAPGVGKSYMTIHAGISVATGREFLGTMPAKTGSVAWISEDPVYMMKYRHREALGLPLNVSSEAMAIGLPSNIYYLSTKEEFDTELFNLMSREAVESAIEKLEELRKDAPDLLLVIIDSLYAMADLRDYMEKMSQDFQPLKAWAKRCGIAVMLVHHTRKGEKLMSREDIRGSQFINAFVQGVWLMSRNEDAKREGRWEVLIVREGKVLGDHVPIGVRVDKDGSLVKFDDIESATAYRAAKDKSDGPKVRRSSNIKQELAAGVEAKK